MTTDALKEYIKKSIDEELRKLYFFIYYQNNSYKNLGLYCGPDIYSYEDDVYSVRGEINRRFRLAVLKILKDCLNEKYIASPERFKEEK